MVAHNSIRLTRLAKALEIPIVSTCQNPRVFGQVVDELKKEHYDGVKHFEKTVFSMLTPEVESFTQSLERPKVVLYGVETHVCVK